MSNVPPNMPPGGGAPPPYPPYDPKTQWRMYREQQKAAWRAQRDAWKAQRYAMKANRVAAYGPRVPSVVGPIILIAIGVIALLMFTGHIDAGHFWSWYGHWWPLLLIGAGLGMLVEWAIDLKRETPVRRSGSFIGILIFLAVLGRQFAQATAAGIRELPVVKEGILNTPCRAQRQRAIIEFFREHYDGKRVLAALGRWPCVMPEVGIYFRNTLSSQNRKFRAQMQTEPEKWVEWIIRGDGDAIDSLMQAYPQAFTDFEVVDQGEFQGEGGFKIYRLRKM